MNEILTHAIMLLLGFVINFWIFPRNKNINVADDYVESQKTKDNRKFKHGGFVPDKDGYIKIHGSMTKREVIKLWKSIKDN